MPRSALFRQVRWSFLLEINDRNFRVHEGSVEAKSGGIEFRLQHSHQVGVQFAVRILMVKDRDGSVAFGGCPRTARLSVIGALV